MPFIGAVRASTFNFVEQGWLLCNGQRVSKNQFAALYAVIGDAYGPFGQADFALPNLNGRAVGGASANNARGSSEGAETVTLTLQQLPSHNHLVQRKAPPNAFAKKSSVNGTTNLGSIAHVSGTTATVVPSSDNEIPPNPPLVLDAQFSPQMIGIAGGGQPHENRQPYLALMYCINYDGEFPVAD